MKKRNYKVQFFVKPNFSLSPNLLLLRYYVHATDALSALDYAKKELFHDIKNPVVTDIMINVE